MTDEPSDEQQLQREVDEQQLQREVAALVSAPAPTILALTSTMNSLSKHNSDYTTSVVRNARYFVALAWLLLGQQKRCDAQLKALSMSFRLNAACFLPRRNAELPPLDGPLSHVWSRDTVLSEDLLATLRHGFREDSRFWTEHGYREPGCPFFSYLYPLDEPPRNAIEEAIQAIHRITMREAPDAPKALSCEWWAHRRSQGARWLAGAHPLHFDTDERTFGSTRLLHPASSCILYLEGELGPTLITDKTPQTPGLGKRGLLAWPQQNRVVSFPGNLLHGVLPAKANGQAVRVSLIMAWWGLPGAPRDDNVGKGPCQRCPKQGWPSEFRRTGNEEGQTSCETPQEKRRKTEPVPPQGPGVSLVEPLWESIELPAETQLVDQSVEAEGTVPLRFFVAHAKAFEELYAESERALAGDR